MRRLNETFTKTLRLTSEVKFPASYISHGRLWKVNEYFCVGRKKNVEKFSNAVAQLFFSMNTFFHDVTKRGT